MARKVDIVSAMETKSRFEWIEVMTTAEISGVAAGLYVGALAGALFALRILGWV